MIHIPTPVKYDKAIHFGDRITKPLDTKADLEFIRKVLSDLENDHAEVYLVRNERGKVIICRKRLKPAIEYRPNHHYFALRNRSGKVIVNGKNTRRVESMICVLRAMFRRNPTKLSLLARNHDMSVAERCDLFNYTLCKQSEPF